MIKRYLVSKCDAVFGRKDQLLPPDTVACLLSQRNSAGRACAYRAAS
jgi:hypothetical protein